MRIVVAAAVLALVGPAALAQDRAGSQAPQAPRAAAKAAAGPGLDQLAAGGNADAQYRLGLAHKTGKGARRAPADALIWFMLAGANGVAEAAVEAARAFERGAGAPRSLGEAARWWYRAGELGDEAARQRFVELVLDGKVRSLGGPAGAAWIEAEAENGDLRAQSFLGEAYALGLGVLPDHQKALHWYRAAALMGDAETRFRLGRFLLELPGVVEAKEDGATRVSRPGMVEGERWLRAAAGQGAADAQFLLGRAYAEGVELPPDPAEAVRWLGAAAAQGHVQAMVLAAEMAANGYGLGGRDPVRAWVLLDSAAQLGSRTAAVRRDALARAMSPRQQARARQLAEDMRGLTASD